MKASCGKDTGSPLEPGPCVRSWSVINIPEVPSGRAQKQLKLRKWGWTLDRAQGSVRGSGHGSTGAEAHPRPLGTFIRINDNDWRT